MRDVIFIEVEDVRAWHARGLAVHGGQAGERDPGLLESAVMAPRTGYYASLAELAAAYLFGLAKNHPFLDGNKRAAFTAAFAFLAANGVALPALDTAEWVAIVESVAAGSMDRETLVASFTRAMGDPGACS